MARTQPPFDLIAWLREQGEHPPLKPICDRAEAVWDALQAILGGRLTQPEPMVELGEIVFHWETNSECLLVQIEEDSSVDIAYWTHGYAGIHCSVQWDIGQTLDPTIATAMEMFCSEGDSR